MEDCLTACEEALIVDSTNTDILQLCDRVHVELNTQQRIREENDKLDEQLRLKFSNIYDVLMQMHIRIGFPSSADKPMQLSDILPQIDSNINSSDAMSAAEHVRWPLLFLYPQYNKLDVVESAGSYDLIGDHLACMFPDVSKQ